MQAWGCPFASNTGPTRPSRDFGRRRRALHFDVVAPAVEITDASVRFRTTQALRDLTWTVQPGQITALLGPNGAGKTTTMALISGLLLPNSGRVTVLGGPAGRLAARARLGVMLQEGGIPTGATGPSIVRHHADLRGAPETATALIEELHIGELGRTTFRRMSGGQRKRVALACALVGNPELVIVDEPTANLDPAARRQTWDLLDRLRRAGVTVILSTHDLEEAERLGDRIAIMDHGQLVAEGTLSALIGGHTDAAIVEGPLRLDLTALREVLPDTFGVAEILPGRYRIDGQIQPQHVAIISAWAGQHGIPGERLRIGTPTLEDLYFSATSDGASSGGSS